ncbi:SMP-30/gluconolactonase/LRE family protein [Rhizobium sp. RAF56]|jgi:sugar lactone lactonase YvrE|uniref:SMP-30/gluconolactonase/LRE family protein n=1 Tax=Rhizobium sp. RAF56 TaxID=3233062 RepID=UPI003F993901
MTYTHDFRGKVLSGTNSLLGEGPTYDPDTDTVWWFNILGKELHELNLSTGRKQVHDLPMMASVLARVDAGRQLIATEEGLFLRDVGTGALTLHALLEPGQTGNRSNDGRTHVSGALWIGTMGKRAETGAGAIYHVAAGKVTKLFDKVSIPNSICFSPDGTIGYYVDSKAGLLMRVPVDPASGLPSGEATVLVDSSDESGDIDGSVCDVNGHIWNARWGSGFVDHYAPDGQRIERYRVPVAQPTCPVFIGRNADRLAFTSAREGLDEATLTSQPSSGALLELAIAVQGSFDPPYRM